MVGCNIWARTQRNNTNTTQCQIGCTEEQKPQKRTICQALRKNCHWKCFALTLMIIGCITLIVWCQVTQYSYTISPHASLPSYHYIPEIKKGPCEPGYNFIPIAFAVMLYVVYLMECWHCKTRSDLLCKANANTVYDYINQLRQASPVVWWRAVCYHYLRRTRQVTRYRNGDTITSTQVYYERVTSHSAGSVYLYHDAGVKDISKKLIDLEKYPITKIRFTKGFVFTNLQSANEFEEQRARFFQENEQRDDYMEVREGLDLVNVTFKEEMACFASNLSNNPWFLSQWCFWLCSLLLSSWPLRMLIECKTAYINYQVTKLFGSNYLSPSNANYTGPLTRVSTMDSQDLEIALRNTYVMVPSYSEALLMDPFQNRTVQMMQDRQGNLHIQTRRSGNNFLVGSNGDVLNNERVLTNYGALVRASDWQILPFGPPRSRSMSFQRTIAAGDNLRSLSFGNIVSIASGNRNVYRTLPITPEDAEYSGSRNGVIPDEPPPSYDTALQMCQPLYDRLRRSATSESRFKWFTALTSSIRDKSHGTDKDDTLL